MSYINSKVQITRAATVVCSSWNRWAIVNYFFAIAEERLFLNRQLAPSSDSVYYKGFVAKSVSTDLPVLNIWAYQNRIPVTIFVIHQEGVVYYTIKAIKIAVPYSIELKINNK